MPTRSAPRAPVAPASLAVVAKRPRCGWCGKDPLYVAYHDDEWGVPVHDDRKLFEFLVLESAQAGLSWITILRKREGYRKAFADFDAEKVARFTEARVEKLMQDASIVRNRAKIVAAIGNARAFLTVQREFGSFAAYQWRFVDGAPQDGRLASPGEARATSPESIALGKDLKKRGFAFLGPTTIYAHMQAVGMVNDHLPSCFRYAALGGGAPAKKANAKARSARA